jgi:tetratricopeptide (TPR) repeat protein
MTPEEAAKKSKRYARWAIGFCFLFALLWPIGSFARWILSGAAVYFGFLFFYYKPRAVTPSYIPKNSRREPRAKTSITISKPLKLVLFFVFLSALTLLIVVSIFVSSGNGSPVQEDEEWRAWKDSLVNNPGDLDALTNLGNRFFSAGQYDSALTYYDRVLHIDPNNSSGLYNKALVLFQLTNHARSIEILRQCIRLYPDYAEAHMVLGDNYYVQEQYTEAIGWYMKAYEKGARYPGLLHVMGYIFEQQDRKAEAIKFYKEALLQDSSLVEVYERLSELEPGLAEWYKKRAEQYPQQ